jgi:hypothetical protein
VLEELYGDDTVKSFGFKFVVHHVAGDDGEVCETLCSGRAVDVLFLR